MKRRDWIRQVAFATAGAGLLPMGMSRTALAHSCPVLPDMDRMLVHVMLKGGADFRFLFMPRPGVLAHEELLFESRRNLYSAYRSDRTLSYEQIFDLHYDVPEGQDFGILKQCGWLTEQFNEGNVAIVPNAYCSLNRRHNQSILNAEVGEPGFDMLKYERDGWGGRLVELLGLEANAVELGSTISVLNKGTSENNRLAQVIHAKNTRDIALPQLPEDGGKHKPHHVMNRALKSYYQARGDEVLVEKDDNWPFHAFFDHNAGFRGLGDEISARLGECGDLPAALQGSELTLNNGGWGQQCRNLYDLCLAPDLFRPRVVSMGYGGWDTHHTEEIRIGSNLEDIFGAEKGLARVTGEISALENNASEQMVFFFGSDFGRQLVANGNFGTDHGRGTYSVIIGKQVQGGVFGEMFPFEESIESNGVIPLQRHGSDIKGRTSTERILAELCDWMQPDTGGTVFPGASTANLEEGVSLQSLMAV